MTRERGPLCDVFTDSELTELRKVPGMMKLIVALFIAIVVLIFIPFQTISQLSGEVGKLTAIIKERQLYQQAAQTRSGDRLLQLEQDYAAMEKKFYWINRNSREANEGVKEVRKFLNSKKSP